VAVISPVDAALLGRVLNGESKASAVMDMTKKMRKVLPAQTFADVVPPMS
jgi:hypothetical protein